MTGMSDVEDEVDAAVTSSISKVKIFLFFIFYLC